MEKQVLVCCLVLNPNFMYSITCMFLSLEGSWDCNSQMTRLLFSLWHKYVWRLKPKDLWRLELLPGHREQIWNNQIIYFSNIMNIINSNEEQFVWSLLCWITALSVCSDRNSFSNKYKHYPADRYHLAAYAQKHKQRSRMLLAMNLPSHREWSEFQTLLKETKQFKSMSLVESLCLGSRGCGTEIIYHTLVCYALIHNVSCEWWMRECFFEKLQFFYYLPFLILGAIKCYACIMALCVIASGRCQCYTLKSYNGFQRTSNIFFCIKTGNPFFRKWMPCYLKYPRK